jgi:hypothetical protein
LPKTAAATARQKSASRPVHRPLASLTEKPSKPSLTPQRSTPFDFTLFRTSPDADIDGIAVKMLHMASMFSNHFISVSYPIPGGDKIFFYLIDQK